MKILILVLFALSNLNAQLLFYLSDESLEPETITYRARVIADGGQIININAVDSAIAHAKTNGYWDSVTCWIEADFGVKITGGVVKKIYDLKGNYDFRDPDTKGFSLSANGINNKYAWRSTTGKTMISDLKLPDTATELSVFMKTDSLTLSGHMKLLGTLVTTDNYVLVYLRTQGYVFQGIKVGTEVGSNSTVRAIYDIPYLYIGSWSPSGSSSTINNGTPITAAARDLSTNGQYRQLSGTGYSPSVGEPFIGYMSAYIMLTTNNIALRNYLNTKYVIY